MTAPFPLHAVPAAIGAPLSTASIRIAAPVDSRLRWTDLAYRYHDFQTVSQKRVSPRNLPTGAPPSVAAATALSGAAAGAGRGRRTRPDAAQTRPRAAPA